MVRPLKAYGRSHVPAPPGAPPGVPAPSGAAPLGGGRAEAMRRLQTGAIGVVVVLLLIGLASMIKDRATQSDSSAVAGAAATTAPAQPTEAGDPLVEAGVVPEIPDTATQTPPAAATAPAASPAAVPDAR